MDDTTPDIRKPSFICPHCAAYAQQTWSKGVFYAKTETSSDTSPYGDWEELERATCGACGDYSIWKKNPRAEFALWSLGVVPTGGRRPQEPEPTVDPVWAMIWPRESSAELPHQDMPENLVSLYGEARAVFNDSPRSSAALLRLLTEMLLQQFTEKDTIYNMIRALVKNGLDPRLQRTADYLRLAGNDAVHPTPEIDVEGDTPERVAKMFRLVNKLVQDLITSPREIDDLYESLPLGKRQAIEAKDGGGP